MTFKHDRLENEKNEPIEGNSLKFINIPLVLIALFIGFGVSYLALRTPNTSFSPGDSRTPPETANGDKSGETKSGDDIAAMLEKGKQIFTTTCQACHQATGTGVPGAFPPLAESEWVNGPPKRMVAIILHGLQGEITVKGQNFQNVMPPFKDQLKPEDIAAVATYVRNSFGNKSNAIPVELVNQTKEETKARTNSWNGQTELNGQKWE
jgi:mono/diheme cytochrome c family protein